MRLALALLLGLSACGAKRDRCDSVDVVVAGSTKFELPARAAHCLYTPDAPACCKDEGASCEQLAGQHIFASIEHRPGCSAPPTSKH